MAVEVPGTFDAGDKWKTFPVQCVGGLNSSVDTLSYKPGDATALVNFEPSLYGGYRRINGFAKYDTNTVPGSGNILGVCVYNGATPGVVACRGTDVYFSSGAGWNTHINGAAPRTGAGKYRFAKYVLGASHKIAMCDGVNPAATWDGTTYTLINGTGAPANPKYCTFFLQRLVLAGYSAKPGAISISAPNSDTDFSGTDNAVEIQLGGQVVGIQAWRGTLFIFCTHEIYELTGTSISDFAITPTAHSIGCIASDTIQEINGNLVYLAPDGIRTVTGTERIGDTGLASISKQILSITNPILSTADNNPDNICSCVIRTKNQYRLFYPSSTNSVSDALGILGAVRQGHSVNETAFGRIIDTWEWGQIQGIYALVCDSDYINETETVVHGYTDGFIYQQENGNSFNGANINATYTSAPLPFDDIEIRKAIKKLDVFYRVEGLANITAAVQYDFLDTNVLQPSSVTITEGGQLVLFDGANINFDSGVEFDSTRVQPKVTTNVQGSGFIVQVAFSTNDTNPSYSIQAFSLQYRTLGRR